MHLEVLIMNSGIQKDGKLGYGPYAPPFFVGYIKLYLILYIYYIFIIYDSDMGPLTIITL